MALITFPKQKKGRPCTIIAHSLDSVKVELDPEDLATVVEWSPAATGQLTNGIQTVSIQFPGSTVGDTIAQFDMVNLLDEDDLEA